MGNIYTLPYSSGTFCRVCGVALRLLKKGEHGEFDKPDLFVCANSDCELRGIVIVGEFEVA